jgi:3-oxoadipyl-CoA thiolase
LRPLFSGPSHADRALRRRSQGPHDDLAAVPIRALLARNPKADWSALDEVVLGCANQAGEDNRNVARMALLLAGLPDSVGLTVNRLCASGGAVGDAHVRSAGEMDLVSGGVES